MFRDAWTLDDLDVEWLGGIAEENPRVYSVITASRLTNGKGMQSYLCMMAVRLMEMQRILRPTGSIYLHCDPTASHYLKLIMDAIFGEGNFRTKLSGSEQGSQEERDGGDQSMTQFCSTQCLIDTNGVRRTRSTRRNI